MEKWGGVSNLALSASKIWEILGPYSDDFLNENPNPNLHIKLNHKINQQGNGKCQVKFYEPINPPHLLGYEG
jgi:hypothetical protein